MQHNDLLTSNYRVFSDSSYVSAHVQPNRRNRLCRAGGERHALRQHDDADRDKTEANDRNFAAVPGIVVVSGMVYFRSPEAELVSGSTFWTTRSQLHAERAGRAAV